MAHTNSAYDRTESYRYATKQHCRTPPYEDERKQSDITNIEIDEDDSFTDRLKKFIPIKAFWFWVVIVCVVLAIVFVIVGVSIAKDDSAKSSDPIAVTGQPEKEARRLPDTWTDIDIISLTGEWRLNNSAYNISAQVPGCVHTALMKANIIGDPYSGYNDLNYRWIHNDDWQYERYFTVVQQEINSRKYQLICDGLDTIADIYINSELVGSSRNQFVKYTYDISTFIKPGMNHIRVYFMSAVKFARTAYENHPYKIVPECPLAEYKPECHANMIRKSQASFGWDWGPAFVTQGIWRNIYIKSYNAVSIQEVTAAPYKQNTDWMLNVAVDLNRESINSTGVLFCRIPELNITSNITVDENYTSSQVSFNLRASRAEAWWPRGYGRPKLYKVTVMFVDHQFGERSSKEFNVGFRTVELVQDPIKNGLTFYFKINGLPIFMKGSNWIPGDSFQDRMTYQRYKNLLQSAYDANMNTIRVWGGGIYEDDHFYDLADEMGLMVWQDLMFACSMYPADSAFLDNVKDEIRTQVSRLRVHPSVVAWTGNNENEGALVDNWYGTKDNYTLYRKDYITLYIDTIKTEIEIYDKTIPFISSSPTNGKETDKAGGVSLTPRPSVPNYGDVHYYNYQDDCWDHTKYLPTRFASEYGLQSWSSYETMKQVSRFEDWYASREWGVHRQHKHEAGNGTDIMLGRHFIRPNSSNLIKSAKDYIYLTQITQAICYKVQTEVYRRNMGDRDIKTMGALYWQLNDIWQAPTWSSIEYGGKWKMVHYFAKRFFHDPIISSIETAGALRIWIVSDLTTALDGPVLRVRTWKWSSMSFLYSQDFNIPQVGKQTAEMSVTKDMNEVLKACGSREECFITMDLLNSTDMITRVAPTNTHWVASFNQAVGMLTPNIKISSVMETSHPSVYDIFLTTDAISAFTWLTADPVRGRFSDNGFLMTSQNTTVQFHAWEAVTVEQLERTLTVTNLMDIYKS